MGTYLAKSVTQKTQGREAINPYLNNTYLGRDVPTQGGVYVIAAVDDGTETAHNVHV